MSAHTPSDDTDLAARVSALEVENASLRAALATGTESDAATGSEAGAATAPPRTARWRAWVSASCNVIAAILIPVSIVAAWARVQLVDEESFVATLAPLASDAAVQDMIIEETMQAIGERVDYLQLTSTVIDGVAALEIPPAAVAALQLLRQPAADGLEGLVDRAVTRIVRSEAFADVWTTATRAAHRALTTAATSDGGGLVVRTPDGVGIQLGAIVERVTQNLSAQGVGIAGLIPTVDRVVIIGTGENLALIRTGHAIATAVGYWLPLVSLTLLVAGILIARRRSVALIGAGLGMAVGGGALAAGLSIGAAAIGSVAPQIDLSPSALAVIYGRISDGMAHTATVVAVLGVALAVLAWTQSSARAARRLRSGIGALNDGVRRTLATRGGDTGAFGRWMFEHRVLVRSVIAALVIAWLLLLKPLSGGEIALVLIVGLAAWWLAEILQHRPGDDVVADTAEDAGADAL